MGDQVITGNERIAHLRDMSKYVVKQPVFHKFLDPQRECEISLGPEEDLKEIRILIEIFQNPQNGRVWLPRLCIRSELKRMQMFHFHGQSFVDFRLELL